MIAIESTTKPGETVDLQSKECSSSSSTNKSVNGVKDQ
jgi:hypothetical protein